MHSEPSSRSGGASRRLLLGAAAAPAAIFALALSGDVASADITQIKLREGQTRVVPTDSSRDVFAQCRLGEQLVGGGFVSKFAYAGVSAPDPGDPRRWFVRLKNPSTFDARKGTAYAYCASDGGADRVKKIVQRQGQTKRIGRLGAIEYLRAECRPGEQLVGGGALVRRRNGFSTAGLGASGPKRNRWFVEVSNFDPEAIRATAYAYCASREGTDAVKQVDLSVTGPVLVPSGRDAAEATAICAPGTRLIGGGALSGPGTQTNLTISAPHPTLARAWLARASNYQASTQELNSYAFCAS